MAYGEIQKNDLLDHIPDHKRLPRDTEFMVFHFQDFLIKDDIIIPTLILL